MKFFIFIITVAMVFASCSRHSYRFPFRPQGLFDGYTTIAPPFDENELNAIDVAIDSVMKADFDTSTLNMELMENDSTYLVDFMPKDFPIRIKDNGDTIMTVVCDGNTTVIVSKSDLTVLIRYGPF